MRGTIVLRYKGRISYSLEVKEASRQVLPPQGRQDKENQSREQD